MHAPEIHSATTTHRSYPQTAGSFFPPAHIQPKLTVNEPGDVYEQEADAMADRVMRMPAPVMGLPASYKPAIQRKCEECEKEEKLQRKTDLSASDFATSSAIATPAKTNTHDAFIPAHQLAQSIQMSAAPGNMIQRAVHSGTDWAGRYEFNDTACTLNYSQDWYFQFPDSMDATRRTAYMSAAESQVEGVWSHKHRLIPTAGSCPCSPDGVDVAVDLRTHNEAQRGRHGYTANVTTAPTTGLTTLPLRDMTLSDTHDTPVNMGDGVTQQRIAHEFGHALNMRDEYTGWASFWGVPGYNDRTSIMHSGDDVRPRHYQPFADIISNTVEGCTYRPAGLTSSSLVNPVARFGITSGITLDANPQFVVDLRLDRRLGNTDLLGLFTPRLGFETLMNTGSGNFMFGPTIGFDLNRFQHPIYLDVHTGLLYDPADPTRPESLNIPLSLTAGFRGSGFSGGVNYTGLVDVLGNSGYSHILGVNFMFDLPGGGPESRTPPPVP